MNLIEELKQEHREIERELIELEAIMDAEVINYGNLVHTFKNLYKMWDLHEKKEEILFPFLEKSEQKIKISVEEMLFDHKVLKPHKKVLLVAIDSGSEFEMRKALENSGVVIIKKLREHIDSEDEVLYRVTMDIFGSEELNRLWNLIMKDGK